ncbi:MAG: S8 family serine peptidase [Methylovulum sp.]|nr:S8 family serine peptidase [Methylovulum sp.]
MIHNRRYRWLLLALVWLLSATGCWRLPLGADDLGNRPKQLQARQIIVTLPAARRAQWLAIDHDIRTRYALQAAGEFPLASIQVNCLVYRVPETVAMDEIISQLRTDPRIQLVQTNQVFAGLKAGENDAYATLSYGPKMIHADMAHRIATGKGVSITVIDTGADQNHPDLKGRVATTRNFVEGGERSFTEDRHGTAVVGIIGARANDGIGIYGVAPEAKIAVFKACWYTDTPDGKALCSSWTLAKALDAAIVSGSRIINLSLNGPDDTLLTQLLDSAHRHHIVLVAAAQDIGEHPGFPASLDHVIPVMSSGPNGDTAHPGWAATRDALAAPGVEILTTAPRESYAFLSGSSLATAHVSGVIALLLQYQARLEPADILAVLKRTGWAKAPSRAPVIVDACRALTGLGAVLECP